MALKAGKSNKAGQGSGSLHRRGSGLGTGPVGNGKRPSAGKNEESREKQSRPQSEHVRPNREAGDDNAEDRGLLDLLTGTDSEPQQSSASAPSKGGFGKIIIIGIILLVLFGGGGSLFKGCLGGSSQTSGGSASDLINLFTGASTGGQDTSSLMSGIDLSQILSGGGNGTYGLAQTGVAQNNSGWVSLQNIGRLNTEVAAGSRKKYTKLVGNGNDTVTIMVYMCGTDLESQYGMASSDLSEMAQATHSDNVRFIVYTGGCSKWKTSGISNQTNMIWEVKDGGINPISQNEGQKAMTNPSTLAGFIQFCANKYKANRYGLVLWDHGGGSVTGYGYDEKYKSSGSMSLDGINTALENGGVKFDFIGFDACLMATAETALTMANHADYMIASEESEPGVGWYYTNWVTALSKNPSMSTLELGKQICDDFVKVCATSARGQSTTLSLIDLAEFSNTVPKALKDFSTATTSLVASDYATVSKARSGSREFAASSGIDQVDLVNFAKKLNTKESNALADALLSAVKYNNVSSDMTNSYGVSIYFPYRNKSYVAQATKMYNAIGMDSSYSKCIKTFAQGSTSGQIAAGGNASQSGSIFGLLDGGSNQASSSYGSSDLLSGLLGSYLGGGTSSGSSSGLGDIGSLFSMLGGRSIDFSYMEDREVSTEDMAAYIAENQFNPEKLNWAEKEDGSLYLDLTKEDWKLINEVVLSMYYDDGEGYIDLGTDNIFGFDKDGKFLAPEKAVWLTLNGQLVPFYAEGNTSDGKNFSVRGYIPALLNAKLDGYGNWEKGTGSLVKLIVEFTNEYPEGKIIGATYDYSRDAEIDVIAKSMVELEEGDVLDIVADYYTYDGEYVDTFMVGDRIEYTKDLKLGHKEVDEGRADMMYRFTDIYSQQYWSQCLTNAED